MESYTHKILDIVAGYLVLVKYFNICDIFKMEKWGGGIENTPPPQTIKRVPTLHNEYNILSKMGPQQN